MSLYRPDEWVMLKITSPEWGTIYKVFAGWQGGFASGDSWKLSSGTVKAELKITKKMSGEIRELQFLQETGSTYVVYQYCGGRVGGWRAATLDSIIEQIKALGATVEIMSDDTDFMAIDYSVGRIDNAAN